MNTEFKTLSISGGDGSVTIVSDCNLITSVERRREPRCAAAEPLTPAEMQALFDAYVERCGGADGSEQARALYLGTPALARAHRERARRDRRWLGVSALVLVGGSVAALFQPHWLGL